MAVLFAGENLSKSYGPRRLFSAVRLSLADGERVGLIGPNGSGKSTLLKIIARDEDPDDGAVTWRKQVVIGLLPQEERFSPGLTVEQVLAAELERHHMASGHDHLEPHEHQMQVAIALTRAGFDDPHRLADVLSGGWRKRLALARELVKNPDVLLLDEPTNHLDLEGIRWLEDVLMQGQFASLFVTHDRYLLENVATRVVELNAAYPQGAFSVDGPYSTFLEKREEFLESQRAQQASLASTVRREIEWLRRGAKARTTKAKGRIEQAGRMMDELADLRTRNAHARTASMDFSATGRQTRKLIAAKSIAMKLGGRSLFHDLTFTLTAGSRLGLVGDNGSGKTTLIRLISGEMEPDQGTVQRAEGLQIVRFDQDRGQLDQTQTLRRALAPQGDTVSLGDSTMHVSSWARRFLFRTEQLDMPVADLSGGEQARVLIAQLMLRPADVLILDEPTNDLDIPTLEVLEESLEEFAGAVVLVTHDRFMLERLSDQLIGLDGQGGVGIYANLAQWERAVATAKEESENRQRSARESTESKAQSRSTVPPPGRRRLNWKEQREWETIEANILAAEAEVEACRQRMEDPQVLADHQQVASICRAMEAAQTKVAAFYARWAELEAKQQG